MPSSSSAAAAPPEKFDTPLDELSTRVKRIDDAIQQAVVSHRQVLERAAAAEAKKKSKQQQLSPPPGGVLSRWRFRRRGLLGSRSPPPPPKQEEQEEGGRNDKKDESEEGETTKDDTTPTKEEDSKTDMERNDEAAATDTEKKKDDEKNKNESTTTTNDGNEDNNKSMNTSSHSTSRAKPKTAKFIDITDAESLIENLRRVAELVVYGENVVTTQQKKKVEEFQRDHERWARKRDMMFFDEDETEGEEEEEVTVESAEQYMYLFDHFFERNALEMIVNMLTGDAFAPALTTAVGNSTSSSDGGDESSVPLTDENLVLLPPLDVATQAIQSISILMQNVSRATSLFILLSNNHINKLIHGPIDLYSVAIRRELADGRQEEIPHSTTGFASPEISELTTHFVTFLKSLAMRMNAETLQFFLKYPHENAAAVGTDSRPVSESHFCSSPTSKTNKATGSSNNADSPERTIIVDPTATTTAASSPETKADEEDVDLEGIEVEFPLYDRALDFCAAHQDSFVRVTAMNICLNTLRLTTVSDDDEAETSNNDRKNRNPSPSPRGAVTSSQGFTGGISPDGVLYNSKPLPFRERLAIARNTCAPRRVERLCSPIFTSLAERWNSLDETLREIAAYRRTTEGEEESSPEHGSRSEKVAKAKEQVRRDRLIRQFKDKAANLQDELLLLEDVFKVGLTVLNEQLIEMMLATFVYPLLLQPLLIYHQRWDASERPGIFYYDPFGCLDGDYGGVEQSLKAVAGPAKTALVTLSALFCHISNRPLLRLVFVALFHPLSPDSNSVPTVRSTLEVASMDGRGRPRIRLDEDSFASPSGDTLIPDGRSSYEFGTNPRNRRVSKQRTAPPAQVERDGDDDDDEETACAFVLSPALAEVLEFKGESVDLITRTRPNPYRRALWAFLSVPFDFADIRELTVHAVDAAVSCFDAKFVSDIFFGTDLKSVSRDDSPMDEQNVDAAQADIPDDREIGGGGTYDATGTYDGLSTSQSRAKGGSVGNDLTGEVVSALCSAIVHAARVESLSTWQLDYDSTAVHALLYSMRHNGGAIVNASGALKHKWKQGATFLSERPAGVSPPMGEAPLSVPGCPGVNDPDYDDKIQGMLMYLTVFEGQSNSVVAVGEQTLRLKDSPDPASCSVVVARRGDFTGMCDQVGSHLLPDTADVAAQVSTQHPDTTRELELCRRTLKTLLRLDALTLLLKELSATGCAALRDVRNLAGIAIAPDFSSVDLESKVSSFAVEEMSKQVFSPISTTLRSALLIGDNDEGGSPPERGSTIAVGDRTAISCVCEVSASSGHLFTGEGSGVVAEGVTWQSLYLVSDGDFLLFLQPLPPPADADDGESGAVGRVVTACRMERLTVSEDTQAPNSDSPARRLLLSHKSFDVSPPDLFLFDSLPEQADYGGLFFKVEPYKSGVDVWFEDSNAVSYAFAVLSELTFNAKCKRGREIMEFLGNRNQDSKPVEATG